MPPAPLKIMMNVANPERAFDFGMLPNAGIGLARLEMIIASHIGVHPKALLEYAQAGRRDETEDRRAHRRLCRPGRLLRRSARRRHRDDHRLGRTESGDRAAVGLQVERIRQPDRRHALRAARRKSDDRIPRREPLRRSVVQGCLRARMPRGEEGARGDGADQPVGHDPVRAHARRRPQGPRRARRKRPAARATTASRSS